MEPKPGPYDMHATVAYLDGNVLRKYIETGEYGYTEYELREPLSDDLRYLLPKTQKGKPVLLSAATLKKRNGFGMCLTCDLSSGTYIALYSHDSQKCYYSSDYDPLPFRDMDGFAQWVTQWCEDSAPEDLADIARFAQLPRQHVKYQEGDVFRFKINRRLYGYGRILLNYDQLRKRKEPYWNILAGKPLVCSVYHIATSRDDVSAAELAGRKSLPSCAMMDNRLYYGDFSIIGNIPVGEWEDYPIHYGSSNSILENAVLLQCGRLHRRIDGGTALFPFYDNAAIGFRLKFRLPILLECIQTDSNAPFWNQDSWDVRHDLRNPGLRADLEAVCRQFDLSSSQLIQAAEK